MAVGDFTKEEAEVAAECVSKLFDAFSKRKQGEFLGELNEALCFIGAAKKHAPKEQE